MASHLFPGNYQAGGLLMRTGGDILAFGATGVDLFFVLSGFLITGILYDSLSDTAYFRRFYARRVLRIFPLYYGVLLVLLVLTPYLGIVWHGAQWALLLYLQNTNFTIPVWDLQLPHGLNLAHFWSLAVEEQFYLLWPLAVFLIRDRKRILGWCVAISACSIAWRLVLEFRGVSYPFINSGTLCRADSLLAGAALAMLIRGPEKETVLTWGRWLLLGAAVVLFIFFAAGGFFEHGSPGENEYIQICTALAYTFYALGSAGLIAWCLVPGSIASRVFGNLTLGWFGKYSYGIYVLHMVTLELFLTIFRGWLRPLTGNKALVDIGSGWLMFGLAILFAYASYNLYEKPFLRLKRYFEYDHAEQIPVGEPIQVKADLAAKT
jgi:peptidoglycan/LPS O-acetylase OafA/YrhL